LFVDRESPTAASDVPTPSVELAWRTPTTVATAVVVATGAVTVVNGLRSDVVLDDVESHCVVDGSVACAQGIVPPPFVQAQEPDAGPLPAP
jgi:hypothetical protein